MQSAQRSKIMDGDGMRLRREISRGRKRTPVNRRYTVEEDDEVTHESDLSDDEGHHGLRSRCLESYSYPTQRLRLPSDDGHAQPPTVSSTKLKSTRMLLYGLLVLSVVVVVVFTFNILFKVQKCHNLNKEDERKLLETLRNLKNNFTHQNENLWKILLDGVITISKCEHECPRAILLLSERNAKRTSKCLIAKVSEEIAHFLPDKNCPQTTWKGKDLDCNDCTTKIRSQLNSFSPIVIEELENITPGAAQALHFICDEQEPQFGKNLYLLTMSVDQNHQGRNANAIAQSALRSLLENKIEPDNIEALITRLTGQVAFIQPEPESNLSNC